MDAECGSFCRRRRRAHHRQRHEADGEARDIEHVGGRESCAGDQYAAEWRAGDHGDIHLQGPQRDRRGKLGAGDHARHERIERRSLDPVDRCEAARDHEQRPHRRVRQQAVGEQAAGQGHHGDLGEDDRAAPVERVGDQTADEGGHEQGDQLGESQEADQQRRPGQRVDLERDGDVGDHPAGQ